MEIVDLERGLFYTLTMYLNVDDLKVLIRTSKKMRKKIIENPSIENRILRFDYKQTRILFNKLKENPLISQIDFLEEKKIENGEVVDRFKNKDQLFDYVKNKYLFNNYRFEPLYEKQFKIFHRNLNKKKRKKKRTLEVYAQGTGDVKNPEHYYFKEIDNDFDQIMIPPNFYINSIDEQIYDYEDNILNGLDKNVKKLHNKAKVLGSNFCPYTIIKNLTKN